jgi:hypothetical protein
VTGKREPLPEAHGSGYYPPELEVVGAKTLWLRRQTAEDPKAVNSWASWDGTRWTTTRLPYDVQPASMHWDGASWKPVDTPQARFEEPLPPSPTPTSPRSSYATTAR